MITNGCRPAAAKSAAVPTGRKSIAGLSHWKISCCYLTLQICDDLISLK
jgi:hypothetical protein